MVGCSGYCIKLGAIIGIQGDGYAGVSRHNGKIDLGCTESEHGWRGRFFDGKNKLIEMDQLRFYGEAMAMDLQLA